jgi:ribonuclease HI
LREGVDETAQESSNGAIVSATKDEKDLKKVDEKIGTIIFCDGACSGNPGPGGWAAVVATPEGHVRELGGGNRQTTNNQMELQAVIEGLRYAERLDVDVTVYTDSVYVIKGITQWIWGWMKRGWLTAEGKPVLNKDYWQALAGVVAQRKAHGRGITWKYVRGHTGVPGNERCDEIAVGFSKKQHVSLYDGGLLGYGYAIFDLPIDEGLPDGSSKKREKTVAHSYVSYLGGKAMRHATWADCERRVKGQPGAKFKKSSSSSDETAILESWGVDPKSLKE